MECLIVKLSVSLSAPLKPLTFFNALARKNVFLVYDDNTQ